MTNTTAIAGMPSVLLIDDDVFLLELLRGMLESLGVGDVAVAPDGASALAALAAGALQPGLIVCDIRMPGLDGFQVLDALAQRGYAGGVALMSGMETLSSNAAGVNGAGLNPAALSTRFARLDFLACLAKPVTRAALSDLLQRVAGSAPAPAYCSHVRGADAGH